MTVYTFLFYSYTDLASSDSLIHVNHHLILKDGSVKEQN